MVLLVAKGDDIFQRKGMVAVPAISLAHAVESVVGGVGSDVMEDALQKQV